MIWRIGNSIINSGISLILVILIAHGCTSETEEEIQSPPSVVTYDESGEYTFFHDGISREFILYKPPSLKENAPLLFFLHGYQGIASQYRSWLNLDRLADQYGFAICYPQGAVDFSDTPHWNADLNISNVDDVGFLVNLAQRLVEDNDFDPTKVYTSGLSNGGFMSYTLICQAPKVFYGMASIIGTMSGATWRSCNPAVYRSILQISGVNDQLVPIDGSLTTAGGWGGAPHMDTIMGYWLDRFELSIIDTTFIEPNTEIRKSTDGQGLNLWYYKVQNLGHIYPTPQNEAGFDTGELLFEFFSSL